MTKPTKRMTGLFLLSTVTLIATALSAFANEGGSSSEGGNGGRGFYCPAASRRPERTILLDLWESDQRPNGRINRTTESASIQVDRVLGRIAEVDRPFAALLRQIIDVTLPRMRVDLNLGSHLPLVEDLGQSLLLPDSCTPIQIGGRFHLVAENRDVFYVDTRYEQLLPPTDLAAFRLHEAIYYVFSQFGMTTSAETRTLVGHLFSAPPSHPQPLV